MFQWCSAPPIDPDRNRIPRTIQHNGNLASPAVPSRSNPGVPVVTPRQKYSYIGRTAFTTVDEAEIGSVDTMPSPEPHHEEIEMDDPAEPLIQLQLPPEPSALETSEALSDSVMAPMPQSATMQSQLPPVLESAEPEPEPEPEPEAPQPETKRVEPEVEEVPPPEPEPEPAAEPHPTPKAKAKAKGKAAISKAKAAPPAPKGHAGAKWKAAAQAKKPPPKKLGKLPAAAQSTGGPGGLTTRSREKLVDLASPEDDKIVFLATQFARASIGRNAEEEPEVSVRDRAFVFWMFLYGLKMARLGKNHPIATACSHVSERTVGELVSEKTKMEGSQVQFLVLRIAKPILQLVENPEGQDVEAVGIDIRDNVNVMLGEKPGGLMFRVGYIPEVCTSWKWYKGMEMSEDEFKSAFDGVTELLDANRLKGTEFHDQLLQIEGQFC